MRYYVHYLHFSDYYPHLCRFLYHNISAVVHSGILQVVGWNVELNPLFYPQRHIAQWIKALVRSSDIHKEFEFNSR